MNLKRLLAIIILFVFLAVGPLAPTPARANTEEALIIAGAVIVAYAAFVIIGASAAFGGGPLTLAPLPPEADERRDEPARGPRIGPHCRSTAGSLTLICW